MKIIKQLLLLSMLLFAPVNLTAMDMNAVCSTTANIWRETNVTSFAAPFIAGFAGLGSGFYFAHAVAAKNKLCDCCQNLTISGLVCGLGAFGAHYFAPTLGSNQKTISTLALGGCLTGLVVGWYKAWINRQSRLICRTGSSRLISDIFLKIDDKEYLIASGEIGSANLSKDRQYAVICFCNHELGIYKIYDESGKINSTLVKKITVPIDITDKYDLSRNGILFNVTDGKFLGHIICHEKAARINCIYRLCVNLKTNKIEDSTIYRTETDNFKRFILCKQLNCENLSRMQK